MAAPVAGRSGNRKKMYICQGMKRIHLLLPFLAAFFLAALTGVPACAQRAEGLYGGIQFSFPASHAGKTLGVKGGYRWYPFGPGQLFSLSTEASVNAAFPSLFSSPAEGDTRLRLAVPVLLYADYPLFPNLRLPFSGKVFPLYAGIGVGATYFHQSYVNLPAQDSFYPEWSPRLYLGSVGIEYHFRRDKASDLVLVGRFSLNRLRRLLMGGLF